MRNNQRVEPIDILMIEPNPDDARLFTESLDDANSKNDIHIVTTGEEALDFVHQRGDHEDAPRPDIVFLDLQLPDTTGHEVISTLKETPKFSHIPVIVLTGSQAEEDIVQSYELHANAYVQKPVDPDEFAELARTLEEFWLSLVTLPPKEK